MILPEDKSRHEAVLLRAEALYNFLSHGYFRSVLEREKRKRSKKEFSGHLLFVYFCINTVVGSPPGVLYRFRGL